MGPQTGLILQTTIRCSPAMLAMSVGGLRQTPDMATWEQFEREAGAFATAVRARFEAEKTHVLATIRKDGSPRVSGSEVVFQGPHLSFGSMLGAVKARDLLRDGRCAIHAHPNDGDAKVAGVAVEVVESAENAEPTAGTEPPRDFHAFRLDLTEAVLTSVDEEEQMLCVQVWRPGRPVRTIRRR